MMMMKLVIPKNMISIKKHFSNNIETKLTLLSLSSLSSLSLIKPVHASTLPQIASLLPGMGPADVDYPTIWQGSWLVKQTFTSVNITQETTRLIPFIINKYNKNEPLIYRRVYNAFDDKVVLDRSATQTNMWRALLNDDAAICLWSYNNPNVATIQTSDGKLDEYKVMKRSIERGDYFGYSEFYRIAETATSLQLEVPKIFGCRILARYRQENNDLISGLERMYIYSAETLDINDKPLAIIKSQLSMTRQ